MLTTETSEPDIERGSQIAFALDALRGIVFANGGAVIALLTFIGQAWSKNEHQATIVIGAIKPGLLMFVFGTLFGITAQGLAYLAQLSFGNGKRVAGRRYRLMCISLAVGGIVLFGYGAIAAIQRILALN
jgi:hypothetical protein